MAYRVSNGASLNVDLEHLFRNNGCNKTTLCFSCFVYIT